MCDDGLDSDKLPRPFTTKTLCIPLFSFISGNHEVNVARKLHLKNPGKFSPSRFSLFLFLVPILNFTFTTSTILVQYQDIQHQNTSCYQLHNFINVIKISLCCSFPSLPLWRGLAHAVSRFLSLSTPTCLYVSTILVVLTISSRTFSYAIISNVNLLTFQRCDPTRTFGFESGSDQPGPTWCRFVALVHRQLIYLAHRL